MLQFGAVLQLKDEFTKSMQKALRTQKSFQSDTEKVKKQLDIIYGKKRELLINTVKAKSGIKQVEQAMKPLRNGLVIAVGMKDFFSAKFNPMFSKIKSLTRAPLNLAIYAKDHVSNVLTRIKEKATSVQSLLGGLAIGAAVGAGMNQSLGSGALLEKQMIAMEHFIGVQNKGMSAQQVAATRDKYLADLRTNAMMTPFEAPEVISAGARAVNVMQGNTGQAMGLVKLAEDMAALNPEKDLMQAMEALADAKVGEFERMKEFGFKISAKEFKGFVGKGEADALTDEETMKAYQTLVNTKLNPFFAGGAQKMQSTASGLWATVTGAIGTASQDMGLSILNNFKPELQWLADWFSKNGGKMSEIGNSIANGMRSAFDAVVPVFKFISSGWGEVSKSTGDMWASVKPFVDSFVSGMGGRLVSAFNAVKAIVIAVMPTIKSIFQTVMPIASDLINMVSTAFSWLVDNIIIPYAPMIGAAIGEMWTVVQPLLNGLWNIVKDVGAVIGILAEKVVIPLMPKIVSAISSMWTSVKPWLQGMVDLFEAVADGVHWAVQKFGEFMGVTVEEDSSLTMNPPVYGPPAPKYAVGMNRVPYDNFPMLAHEGERLLTKGQAKQIDSGGGLGSISIGKLADTVVIREEADIDKLATSFVRKLEEARINYGSGVMA